MDRRKEAVQTDSLGAPPHPPSRDLAVQLTSFVDRREEIARAKRLLASARLVTLTGVGGVGKTRLGLRLIQDLERRDAKVYLVELASLRDADLLAHTVVSQLKIPERSAKAPLTILTEFLNSRDILLLLDNCEHLLEATAILVNDLLMTCPAVRILATSRQPLGVPGEHLLPIAPLKLPDPAVNLVQGAEEMYGALTLFRDRASAVLTDFAIDDENRTEVARLCSRLEGIPLAIELAAVRLRALSVSELVGRIDNRFEVLTQGGRMVPVRHQTLRATIDWSYELCSTQEQILWQRCSVFAGGFGLAAAEAVGSGPDLPHERIMDTIGGLVEKSILLRGEVAGQARFHMLETIREYGEAKLKEADQQRGTRERHREFCKTLLQSATAHWFSAEQLGVAERLRIEYPNLRKAFDYCLTQPGLAVEALHLVGRHWFLWVCIYLSEGRHWLERAMSASEGWATAERAEMLATFGYVAALQGDHEAAIPRLDECREIVAKLGDDRLRAYATHVTGLSHLFGDPREATVMLADAVDMYTAAGAELELMIAARMQLGLALIFTGAPEDARNHFEACRQVCQDSGEQWEYSYALYGLAFVDLVDGKHGRALDQVRETIGIKRRLQDILGLSLALDLLGWTLAALGEHRDAAVVLGSAFRLWESCGHQLFNSTHWLAKRQEAERVAVAGLGRSGFDKAFGRGHALSLDEALRFAMGEKHRNHARVEDPLTERERQIAHLIALGKSTKDIASQLVISQRTVEAHVDHIFSKLGFNNRSQLATWVAERRQQPLNPAE